MKNLDANPYVKLVETIPDRILVNSTDQVEEEAVKKIQSICKLYPQLAVELGSGSGSHLAANAHAAPHKAFFGIELRYKRAYKSASRAVNEKLLNLYILRTRAQLLKSYFPANSLNEIYMNFPDPWDKLRWHKNRMASEFFFEDAQQLLKTNGFFSFKTDHEGLYRETKNIILKNSSFIITEETEDLYSSEFVTKNIQTEFEKLFVSKKMQIFYLKAEKI